MTLYEQIEAILTKVDKLGNLKSKSTITFYQNKKDKEDTFTTLEEAFHKGLNLSDYEKVTNTVNLKPTVKKAIFGSEDYIIKKDTAYRFEFLFFIVQELSRKPRKARTPKNKAENEKLPKV